MFNGGEMELRVSVKNTPEYATKRRYIIATLSRGVLWFYGATDSAEQAFEMEQESEQRITLERVENER